MTKSTYVLERLGYLRMHDAHVQQYNKRREVKPRAMQLRRRQRALQGEPVPVEHCEMCGKSPREARRGNQSLCLDHCHETGAFRGWLCHSCNLGLGLLGDNEKALQRALTYIRRKIAKPQAAGVRLASVLKAHGIEPVDE
jgi:hypothetical protein